MKNKSTIPFQFLLGLLLFLASGILMFEGILSLSASATMGIAGLILITTSKYKLL